MKYGKVLLGFWIILPMVLAAGILWRVSEQQYVAMTNLGLRLRVLQQSTLAGEQLSQGNWPSWKTIWGPMITAMQFEAKHALAGWQGVHLSDPMHEQLLRFSERSIESEPDLKNVLSRLNLSDAVFETRLPIVFSKDEQQSSLSAVPLFRDEIAAIFASETAYSNWLSPILQQQESVDKSYICKTLKEIEGFQAFSDRLQSKCASTKNKWTVCGGKDEPVARQIKELRISFEANLAKFKSRWLVKDVKTLCADS